MSYPDLVREFVHGAMTKHATALTEAMQDPKIQALLDLGYRYQTQVVMPEGLDDQRITLIANLVPPPTQKPNPDRHGEVWALTYRSRTDEYDNGVLGVYATEQLARDAGIASAKRDPNLTQRAVEWYGETLMYQSAGVWYEVCPTHYVQAWDVEGA